jgi:hypothetical protein
LFARRQWFTLGQARGGVALACGALALPTTARILSAQMDGAAQQVRGGRCVWRAYAAVVVRESGAHTRERLWPSNSPHDHMSQFWTLVETVEPLNSDNCLVSFQ